MAKSPAHRFGQVIGELLESVVRPQLETFCRQQRLYLDHQKKIRPARPGKKVSWMDQYGNTHDLDFVIERDGTDQKTGTPLAFIETAWRRYTKHSRNKAQEIQGAILPLAEKYEWNNPFLGTILAGVFTDGSLDQLRSMGFNVLYFPYESLVAAFESEGVNIAFDEKTPRQIFSKTTKQIEHTSVAVMAKIRAHLVRTNQAAITGFFAALNKRLGRRVTRVVIIPMYGRVNEFETLEDAVQFLDRHVVTEGSGEFRKYDIRIEFSNGDKVDACMEAKDKVREFLAFVIRQ
ncbi:MAG: DNA methylase [Verrucomicrobia bacterium]|nr:MAG: DNA methylase [Verrucomicrobiota bacterium]